MHTIPYLTFWRLPDDNETVTAIVRIEQAIAERRIVRVSFFKELRNERGRSRWFDDREGEFPHLSAAFGQRKMLETAPVRRTVEPLSWDLNAQGEPYMDTICHDAPSAEYPEMRRIRIDRITVSRSGLNLTVTRRPFVVAGTALDPTRRTPTA